MTWLSQQENVVFLGQGLKVGDQIYGTMKGVDKKTCLEMPVAENLIVGCAIGLSLRGFFPIIVFQRMDFMTVAADAIINHLSLIPKMSNGQFKIPMIIRACVGSASGKFQVGLQHNKDLTHLFEPHLKVCKLLTSHEILISYQEAFAGKEPAILIEYKDNYDSTK